tara:strand:+ start:45 stop:674 length:630 start_codon:yes stop_codon:yes gene_type:complete
MKKKMLIVTGPQGSGNHLFSKILSQHPDVFGWSKLQETYWLGHHTEPFAKYWANPSCLEEFDWSQSDYYVTSISSPFVQDQQAQTPNFKDFVKFAKCHVSDVHVAVIGRDQNILRVQQERVRGKHTTPAAIDSYQHLFDIGIPYFLSQELLYLYKSEYLQRISMDLDWPILHNDPTIFELCNQDANSKYVTSVNDHWLDAEVAKAIACS